MSSRRKQTRETDAPESREQHVEESLRLLRKKVAADPTRPRFHFHPVAGWMNDPNGTIYHDGHYHLFYQHNPYDDVWNNIHWGHARSTNLVDWEHLPIALRPSSELGEASCFSGCATIAADGTPLIFYTKVGPRPEHDPREQWAAIGDSRLIKWKKHPDNPILSVENHGGPPIKGDWRDPYIFHTEGRTFMVVAATLDDQAGGDFVVLMYEAADGSLTKWTFRNILIRKPNYEMSFFECPNFFPVENRWVLLVSPYKPVEYYAGQLNLSTYTFNPDSHGRLDAGMDYYSTNTAQAPDGRLILFGWVRGFRKGRGWNGCLALPREISLDRDGHPVQKPVKEIERLRGIPVSVDRSSLGSKELVLDQENDYRCAELRCSFRMGDASAVEIRLLRARDGRSSVSVVFDGHFVEVAGTKLPYELEESDQKISFHLFVDRSVIEVFVDEGRRSLTRVVYVEEENRGISVLAHGGEAELAELTAWELRPMEVTGEVSGRGADGRGASR